MIFEVHRSFGVKLVAVLGTITAVGVITVGSIAVVASRTAIVEIVADTVRGTLSQMGDNINANAASINRVVNMIIHDDYIQILGRGVSDQARLNEIMMRYLKPRMNTALIYTEFPIRLQVYIDNPAMPEIIYSDMNDQGDIVNPMSRGRLLEIFRFADHTEKASWLSHLEGLNSFVGYSLIDEDAVDGTISYIRRLHDLNTFGAIGAVRIFTATEDFFEAVNPDDLAPGSRIVVRRNGEIVYEVESKSLNDLEIGDASSVLKIRHELTALGLEMTAYVPRARLLEPTGFVNGIIMVGGIVSLSILLLVGIVVSRIMAKRVHAIVHTLDAFNEKSFDRRIELTGHDEFTMIASSFNTMAERIEELVSAVYVSEIRRKELDLRILQAQINPHFLYNTLSSMGKLVRLGKNETVYEMTLTLASFYRLTLSMTDPVGSVDHEMNQIGAYADLLRRMYLEDLVVDIESDYEVNRYETVQFVLQPFLENVVAHGWNQGPLHVVVRAYLSDDSVVFEVIDDGIGMSSEKIDGLFEQNRACNKYGIRNVHERIGLVYGLNFGVSIMSEPGLGTKVRIVQPARRYVDPPMRNSLRGF